MCGVAGKVWVEDGAEPDEALLRRMAGTLAHRGPDDEGILISGPTGLGFRRLSIIDLDGGHQPLSNSDGTIWIAFNGEIYNYQRLRQDLATKGHTFSTESDTEVIVHLYEEYGDAFVHHLTGMFGLAIWDESRQRLVLVRDRVGIKPMYYAETDEGLTFGSEVKALLEDPAIAKDVNPQSLDRFLTYYFLPGSETLSQAINKLEPGHMLVYEDGVATISAYWDLEFNPRRGGSRTADQDALVELLDEVVADHLIADVPVGLLLSGGVDSTAVLSLAAAQGAELSTFTIGFAGEDFADERPYAQLAADRYGTDHYEASMTRDDFFATLPRYVWHMEEPVCEPPAIALYFVAKLAAEHVKVVLSGEGGDEAFAGYSNYRNNTWYERGKQVAGPTRSMVSNLLERVPDQGPRINKYLQSFDIPLDDYYLSRTATPYTYFNEHRDELYSAQWAAKLPSDDRALQEFWATSDGQGILNRMLYVDTKTWLPDDLLLKADKITMAQSLELRVPLLDHRVLEFAASLPSSRKLRGFQTKYLLKEALRAQVPDEIRTRKKTGFPVPYERWIAEASAGPVSDLLLDDVAIDRGYFRRSEIEAMLRRNADAGDLSREVFSLIVLELWHRLFVDGADVSSLSLV
ncbi:MAG: asparagine synthase (glutamine-hydrolyzing) [Acidimicrobiia bacterium]